MEALNQSDLLQSLEKKVESHLLQVKNSFSNQKKDVLLQPSVSGGWSIAQCLEHLNSYGDYYLPAIQSALNQPEGKSYKLFKSKAPEVRGLRLMLVYRNENFSNVNELLPCAELSKATACSALSMR